MLSKYMIYLKENETYHYVEWLYTLQSKNNIN